MLKLDPELYIAPKYSWKKPKFSETRSKKLDYICLFAEKIYPKLGELTKIHYKRKHEFPGPEYYDMTRDWTKNGPFDFQKGKHYKHERVTEVMEHIKRVKREKSPAPNLYKPKHIEHIPGAPTSKSHQLQMIPNAQWYSKQTPGFVHKP